MAQESSALDQLVSPDAFRHGKKGDRGALEMAWVCRITADLVRPEIDLLRATWGLDDAALPRTWTAAHQWLRARERQWMEHPEAARMVSVRVLTADGPKVKTCLVPPDHARIIDDICRTTGWDTPTVVWHALTGGLPQVRWQLQTPLQDIVRQGYLDVRLWLPLSPRTAIEMTERLRATVQKVAAQHRSGRLVGPSNRGGPYGAWSVRARQGRLLMVMAACGEIPVDRKAGTKQDYWRRVADAYHREFRDEPKKRVTPGALRKRYERLRPAEVADFKAPRRKLAMGAAGFRLAIER
jgi:hypothetical protein